jgi:hypothetical protein
MPPLKTAPGNKMRSRIGIQAQSPIFESSLIGVFFSLGHSIIPFFYQLVDRCLDGRKYGLIGTKGSVTDVPLSFN